MTPSEAVYKTLAATGIKGTRVAWPVGHVEPLPWFVYSMDRSDEYASDSNYYATWNVTVDLYEKEMDEKAETDIEAACRSFGPTQRTETWLKSESAYVISFTFTYTPKEGNQ